MGRDKDHFPHPHDAEDASFNRFMRWSLVIGGAIALGVGFIIYESDQPLSGVVVCRHSGEWYKPPDGTAEKAKRLLEEHDRRDEIFLGPGQGRYGEADCDAGVNIGDVRSTGVMVQFIQRSFSTLGMEKVLAGDLCVAVDVRSDQTGSAAYKVNVVCPTPPDPTIP